MGSLRSESRAARAAVGLVLLLLGAGPAAGGGDDPAGLERALARAAPGEPLPAYQLTLGGKALRGLLAYRERIRDQAYLSPDDREWFATTLAFEGERYPARLRIRGDLPMHWRGDKQSFQVKFTQRLFLRQKEINLILPWDKHYGIEWLQTRISGELGVPCFPGRFVNLHVNGRDAGLYYESEQPTAEYLERTGRPASSIFSFASYWSHYFGTPYHHAVFVLPGSRGVSPLEGIAQIKQRRTWERSLPLFAKKQLAYALDFFRLLTSGSREQIGAQAGRYLDLDNVAKYVAIQDFFGSQHGMALNDNVRLYLDPTRGKFEFMPWDTSLRPLAARLEKPGASLARLLEPEDESFALLLAAVPHLREHKDRILRRLVADGDRYRRELNELHARLIRLYPADERLGRDARGIDARLRENLEMLERYFAQAAASPGVPAGGG
jgi:hypothetical protein